MAKIVQGLLLCALLSIAAAQCKQRYCYTQWLNRDLPGGTGDYETLVDFAPSQVCARPVGIQCQTATGQNYKSTGKIFIKKNFLMTVG